MERGQMKLSFGMIFSIILIIIFLSFAFVAIKKFWGTGVALQIGQYRDNLQGDIDSVWNAPQASQEVGYKLPQQIEMVCFVDYTRPAKGGQLVMRGCRCKLPSARCPALVSLRRLYRERKAAL